MKKKWRRSILAVVLGIPLALQIPDWTVSAGEEHAVQSNLEEIHGEMEERIEEEKKDEEKGELEEENAGETGEEEKNTENNTNSMIDGNQDDSAGGGDDLSTEDEPKDVFEGTIEGATEENETTENEIFFADSEKMEEMENTEIFSEEETDDLLSLYAVPVNFVQEGSPVRDGAIGFTPVAIGDRQYSSKYTRLG